MKKLFFPGLLFFSFLLQSCGTSYNEKEIKNYRFYGVEMSSEITKELKLLVGIFNQKVGLTVLTWVNDPVDANSSIIVVSGLDDPEGYIGFGQMLSETEQDNPMNSPFSTPQRTTTYSMRIELDKEYLEARLDGTVQNRYELKKLFFHEIGHGLEMDHDPDQNAVMFKDVSGQKDFDTYFKNVRAYLAK